VSITVRFFASVGEQLGKSEAVLDAAGVRDVADVWTKATGAPRPARLLAAVNLEHAGFDRPVRDGDEVGFFPPVTGGTK
jgi:molybdopterin synthase sulfur carrier subunit